MAPLSSLSTAMPPRRLQHVERRFAAMHSALFDFSQRLPTPLVAIASHKITSSQVRRIAASIAGL